MSETEIPEEILAVAEEAVEEDEQELDAEELLVRERTSDIEIAKYRAAALDRASTALLGFGTLGPVFGLLWGTQHPSIVDVPTQFVMAVACLVVAFVLHLHGKDVLEGALEP